MKYFVIFICVVTTSVISSQSNINNFIITSDIDLFWKAYDKVRILDDRQKQLKIIEEEYIAIGSEGLKSIMKKRGYTAQSYVDAIRNSPSFWESVRSNTLKSHKYAGLIKSDIDHLKKLYPDLKPAQIYFTIGAMMTGGSAYEGHVLIGAELAMADSTVNTEEIEPKYLQENLNNYFKTNPINDLILLNVHEYVHTQQGNYGTDLLSMSIFEGVAEFVSVIASSRHSASPAIAFGKANHNEVRERFQKEMFSPHWNDWLYNNLENHFHVRDLGYYVGYEIAEHYYDNSISKKSAIKEMIELKCDNEEDVRLFVIESEYLSIPYDSLKQSYVSNQPAVEGIKEFENGAEQVDPSLEKVSIQFSKEMNPRFRNFKLGSLGENNLLPITGAEWDNKNKVLELQVELKSNMHYQIIVDNQFRDDEGRTIEKYSIDFKTGK